MPGCAGFPATAPAGDCVGGRPRWRGGPAGRSTTSVSAGSGARRVCESRSAAAKKCLTAIGTAVGAMSPIRPNVIWATDFQSDTTADGRTLKMLNIIDEFTREALAIHIDRSIDADGIVDVLDGLAGQRGTPQYVRFDNGPEFVAHAVNDWCRFNGTATLFIDPGSPWQNAWIESFNGRRRDELLNAWRFDPLRENRHAFDPGHDHDAEFFATGPAAGVQDVALQQGKERFHGGVVPACADPASLLWARACTYFRERNWLCLSE